MEYEIQLLNTKKYLRILLLGIILTLICFVVTFINIKHFGVLTWLFSWIVIIPFFIIGLKLSKVKTKISIDGENYRFGNKEFNLNDVSSYEFTGTGYTDRLNIRLKNKKRISIVCRESSVEKEKFIDLVKEILNNIEIYNSKKNQNEKIAQYDVFHTKYSKLVGLLILIIDILLTYFMLSSDKDQKYYGVVMINILLLMVVIPIFSKKKKKKYFG